MELDSIPQHARERMEQIGAADLVVGILGVQNGEIDAIPMTERITAGEEALRIGRQLGDIDLEVLATRALSGLAMTQGDYAGAMDFTRQEEALVDRIVATRDRALGLFWIGLRYMDTEGHYEEGLALMSEAARCARRVARHSRAAIWKRKPGKMGADRCAARRACEGLSAGAGYDLPLHTGRPADRRGDPGSSR